MKRNLIISLLIVTALLLTACAAAKNTESNDSEMKVPHSMETGTAEAPDATAAVPDTTEKAPETAEQASTTDAVTEAPDNTESETEVGPQEEGLRENYAFTQRFSQCGETVIGLLYNDPFSEGDPIPTEIWNEGEYDKLVIIPRYVGSIVRAYRVSEDAEGLMTLDEEPAFSTTAEDGTEIGASLERPEGMAAWYVSIELPDGRSAGLELNYNGRYGTPLYEFIEDPYLSSLIKVPTAMEDWNPQFDLIGYERFWAFWRAAQRSNEDTWEACKKYFTQLTEVGDGAAFTVVLGGDMDGDTYNFQAARFHSAYFTEKDTLEDAVSAQFELYRAIGNERGILGPDQDSTGEELVYRLTGLTVFNPSLCAKQIQVTVNGIDAGIFDLSPSDFCTLISLDLPDFIADSPISVTVKVISVNYGTPDTAIIDVYPGIGGNISNAI